MRVLMPGVGQGVVRNAIVLFAEQAARLTGVTIAFIAVTAVMLVDTIEHEMNVIFGVRRARPLARRVLVYVIGVSLGPIVVGASISATTWLIAQSLEAVPIQPVAVARWIGQPLPWIFASVAFTLLYKIVPYARVRWSHALVGGVLAAAGVRGREGRLRLVRDPLLRPTGRSTARWRCFRCSCCGSTYAGSSCWPARHRLRADAGKPPRHRRMSALRPARLAARRARLAETRPKSYSPATSSHGSIATCGR